MTDVICDYDFCKHYENGRCGLDSEFTVGCASGTRATSILRSAHGPDIIAVDNVAAVDETHWLDADYLSGIGFSIEVAS